MLHILQGVMPIFELTLYRACMEGAKTQNTDSSFGVLRSRPTKRNEKLRCGHSCESTNHSEMSCLMHVQIWKLKLVSPVFFTLYDLVLPWFVDLKSPNSKLPVCSSSSGTWELGNIVVPLSWRLETPSLSNRHAHIRSYVQHQDHQHSEHSGTSNCQLELLVLLELSWRKARKSQSLYHFGVSRGFSPCVSKGT